VSSEIAHAADRRAFTAARNRLLTGLLAAGLLLLLAGAGALLLGPSDVRVTPGEALAVLASHLPGLAGLQASPEAHAIVWELRAPRLVAAALIGMLLACAGVAFQGLLMNPLADPYTVGVSAGAAVGAAAAEAAGIAALAGGMAGTGAAFAAALLAVALVYLLASVGGRVSPHTFLLAGVVVGTFLWALIPLFLTLAGRSDELTRLLHYLIGSVQSADWSRAGLLAPFAAVAVAALSVFARDLNLVSLGEETAAHLGVEMEAFKRRTLLVGSLATAAAVSVGGIIGFVGLVVPHVARRIVGPDHRAVVPVALLLGAALMLASDTLVRVWLDEMPVGVVTSIVGAPVFCALIRRGAASW